MTNRPTITWHGDAPRHRSQGNPAKRVGRRPWTDDDALREQYHAMESDWLDAAIVELNYRTRMGLPITNRTIDRYAVSLATGKDPLAQPKGRYESMTQERYPHDDAHWAPSDNQPIRFVGGTPPKKPRWRTRLNDDVLTANAEAYARRKANEEAARAARVQEEVDLLAHEPAKPGKARKIEGDSKVGYASVNWTTASLADGE